MVDTFAKLSLEYLLVNIKPLRGKTKAMKTMVLCFALICGAVGLGAQTPEWQWAVRAGGTGSDSGKDIVVDSIGNSYVTGMFQNYVLFGSTALSSSGYSDVFVAKADVDGNWLWAAKAGSLGFDSSASICIDINGNSYITGRFQGTATFGSTFLTAEGDDVFIAKLDVYGNWLWAKRAGGGGTDTGESISVDNNGNCYLTGQFMETSDFGSTTLTDPGPYNSDSNIFVAKLDTNGNWLWAINTGIGCGYGINTDNNGNSYVVGNIQNSANFGSIVFNGSGIFVAKMNTNGNWLWATPGNGNVYVCGVSNDNSQNTYITGDFSGSADFGPFLLTSSGNRDAYVAKMDYTGNWLWVKSVEGPGAAYGRDIASDESGNSFVTGTFVETAVFGPIYLTSNGYYDMFTCILDTHGNWLKASNANGIEEDRGGGIATDGYGNSYVTGYFDGTIFFDSISLIGVGTSDDIFVAKLSPPDPFLCTSHSLNIGTAYLGYFEDSQELILWNYGASELTLSAMSFLDADSPFEVIAPSMPWIIPSNDSISVLLRFTPQSSGTMTDSLLIYNNSLNMPLAKISISGTGVIVPPKPPQNLQIVVNGNDVHLSWELVSETIFNTPIAPDYYFVYHSIEPYGNYILVALTPNLSYTHPYIALGAQRMFYKVTAVKFYRDHLSLLKLESYLKKNIAPGMTEADVRDILNEIN